MKSKKITITLIITLITGILLCSCGNSKNNTKNSTVQEIVTISFAQYKKDVSKWLDELVDTGMTLNNMGTYESNYWSSLNSVNGSIDYEKMLQNTYEWAKEKGNIEKSELDSSYQNICDKYKNLISQKVSDSSSNEINDYIQKLYDNFTALYTIVTKPNGEYDSFCDKFNKCIDNITNAQTALDGFLKE